MNGGSATITNSVFWRDSVKIGEEIRNWYSGEATVTYSNIIGGYPGEGNIKADPLFVDPDNGDFHLKTNSPCKDAGTDAGVYVDIDGDTRPQGAGFDIGADEIVEGLVFSPVTPCRIVDTRKAGCALTPGEIRGYYARGYVGTQGGNPAG